MRTLVRLLAVACLAIVAAIAAAAPFTTAFDPLRADLSNRRAAYVGTLTGAQRRELAAIDACIARIDGPHASISDDAKSLKFVAKRLAKAFRSEFGAASPGPLPGLLAGVASALVDAAEAEAGTLDAAISGVEDPALSTRLRAIAIGARTDLDRAAQEGVSPAVAAAALARAANAIARALTEHAEATAEGVRCTMRGRVWSSESVENVYVAESGGTVTVSFGARLHNPVTGRVELFTMYLSAGVGESIGVESFNPFFPLEPNIARFSEADAVYGAGFYPRNGRCFAVIRRYDAETSTVTGTFDLKMAANPNIQLPMTKGTFRIRMAAPSK